MTNERRVLVHPDKASLASSVSARFITKMLDILDTQAVAHVVLTGGSMGSAVLEAVSASPARTSIDWSRVHFWWGDERWVPRGDGERNDGQANAALPPSSPSTASTACRIRSSTSPSSGSGPMGTSPPCSPTDPGSRSPIARSSPCGTHRSRLQSASA